MTNSELDEQRYQREATHLELNKTAESILANEAILDVSRVCVYVCVCVFYEFSLTWH